MPDFAPDDDRDPDEGWDSMEDYLRERSDDMEYPDSVPDGVHTDRVEVDPELFGELPDGRIEDVKGEGAGPIENDLMHEWQREVALVRIMDACPKCDGPTESHRSENMDGETIITYACVDCNEEWIAAASELPGRSSSSYRA